MNRDNVTKLGKRIPLIGREQEIEHLRTYLRAPGSERHYIYYWAHGGLGKTRLLEELEKLVKEAGPRFYFSGIIDLYHTDTHSTSDLERIIVEGTGSEDTILRDLSARAPDIRVVARTRYRPRHFGGAQKEAWGLVCSRLSRNGPQRIKAGYLFRYDRAFAVRELDCRRKSRLGHC